MAASVKQSDLLKKTQMQFEKKLPFVIYNKPNSDKLIGIFQYDSALHLVNDFNEKGFVFAPFEGNELVLIPQNSSEIMVSDFEKSVHKPHQILSSDKQDEAAKKKYEALVGKAVDAIKKEQFSKVVLSRKQTVMLQNFDLIATFQKLLNEYPSAFAYSFFHPKTGLWLGAFSEQLLKMKENSFQTMAVAGTQSSHENEIVWGEKEKDEQQFVTNFILEKLKNETSEMSVSEPYTLKAGKLMHIKTDIHGTLNNDSGLKEIVDILHPTPAVCGFPKESAKKFIHENEGYDRKYYSGFLGEFNKDFAKETNSTELYVNLRCMQITGDYAELYVGGGVTKDSIPENEWYETVNKTQTMKHILD
jgi:isochorismate synthase